MLHFSKLIKLNESYINVEGVAASSLFFQGKTRQMCGQVLIFFPFCQKTLSNSQLQELSSLNSPASQSTKSVKKVKCVSECRIAVQKKKQILAVSPVSGALVLHTL